MGVDLYAGPLQRYFTRRWETPTQAFARRNGMDYTMTHTSGADRLSLSDQVAIERVQKFRAELTPKLNLNPALWRESFDAPYEALQITREGMGALLLWAAYRHNPDLVRPRRLPPDPWEDAVIAEAYARGYYMSEMVSIEAHIIVPGAEPRVATEVNPIDQDNIIATTAALDGAIEALAPGLDLDAAAAAALAAKGPPPVHDYVMVERARDDPGDGKWKEERTAVPLDEVRVFARWGLACFMQLSAFARENGVPIVRDE
ncbi:MAG: hypothetical protein ACKVRO_11175 [Micropepsaceae bacterium]